MSLANGLSSLFILSKNQLLALLIFAMVSFVSFEQRRRAHFDSWVGKIRWRRDRLFTPIFLGFPYGSAGKESTCNVGDLGGEDPLEKGKATHSSILA